jgi:outer membrane translocation and assembly module TamA
LKGYSLVTEGQQWYTFTPAYESVLSGAKASVIHRSHSQRHSWGLTVTSEHDASAIANDVLTDPRLRNDLIALGLDPRTGKHDGTLNAIGVDAQFNGADNILDARRGYQLAVRLEQAGKIVPGTFQYFGASVDAKHYLPAGRVVIASRLQMGSVVGEGNSSTNPFSKRLFLGGATSIRGWGRYEISPLSGSGLPLGGESLFAWSSEARFPLTEKFGAVGFLDAGNVWADPWAFSLADLRYAVGPGLRYQTPIGPIRFDVGFQINPIPDLLVRRAPQQRRWRRHFSIGQAF